MDIAQLVTLAVGILALVWYQQRSIASLRADLKQDIAGLRADIAAVRDAVVDNSQRLSRIEGFLGIGMPPQAAAIAPGAGLAAAPAETASAEPATTSSN